MTLGTFREQIDSIDADIHRLLSRRIVVVREIAEYKLRSGIPLVETSREDEIYQRLRVGIDERLDEAIVEIFREIIRQSRLEQRTLIEALAVRTGFDNVMP